MTELQMPLFGAARCDEAATSPKTAAFTGWMRDVTAPDWRWFIKVLRGNDTLLNASHQAGPYMSRRITFDLFPSFLGQERENTVRTIPVAIASHGMSHDLNIRWWGREKRETHLTGWGGSKSPVLDPDATGSIIVIAFHQTPGKDADAARLWLCSSVEEEDALQERVGSIEPGVLILHEPARYLYPPAPDQDSPCSLAPGELPQEWRSTFPAAAEIVQSTISRLPSASRKTADDRLVLRRLCEYNLFRSIEHIVVLPQVKNGFATVDLFVEYANSVTNRRKSRSGASLGLHASFIFREEGLPHSYDKVSEGRKRPDFLFPSAEAYQSDPASDRLAMLAAKTTCKDRWRQILNEADRIPIKHLLTLQEGVSPSQFQEMEQAQVKLVVPRRLHSAYHKSIRPKLLTLGDFIAETKSRCSGAS